MPTKRKIKRRPVAQAKPVKVSGTDMLDFSARFGHKAIVIGRRVAHGVNVDVRVFPPGKRHSVVVCFGGSIEELRDWLEDESEALDKVVRELAMTPAPAPKKKRRR
ncbi:MAG: hypothetical protein JRL30_00790 [Deltaproteobacteria bacterium]|nr:hypothetical protein [Deltaproteobacteria bacterium]